jgi:large subunit ribosomal protein L4
MELSAVTIKGSKGSVVAVSDALFGAKMNRDLVWQVATSQMSNRRQVVAHTKTRSEVRGGGKKPWRQKGTGRARHGSIRSPIWVGGGVAHGPTKDVNFKKTITKVQSRKALAAVLSSRATDNRLVVVKDFAVPTGKTKDAAALLAAVTKNIEGFRPADRVLVVLPGVADDVPTRRAMANIPTVMTIRAQDLNTLDVLAFGYLVIAADAVPVIEKTFAPKTK